ncbi:MAG: hypothetical protein KAR42_00100 [candidate division Zixibacteria bacterium]|nr:hypothetical protein [candidate division Zixibacteria bacterium]
MNQVKRILLLVGSAKQTISTSELIGTYLIERLQSNGYETETLFAHKLLKSNSWERLLSSTDRADIIVIAFPLFVDCLPYSVIKSLEQIAGHRQAKSELKEQTLVCLANCGFPEQHHNDTAIAICRQFAREAGFKWAGALSLGGGEAIGGQPLFKIKRTTKNVMKALDLTAEAIALGHPVPQEAIDSMAKPMVPKWIYLLMGGWGWKRRAKKNRVLKTILHRPYEG